MNASGPFRSEIRMSQRLTSGSSKVLASPEIRLNAGLISPRFLYFRATQSQLRSNLKPGLKPVARLKCTEMH